MFSDWSWNDSRAFDQSQRFEKFLNHIKYTNQKLVVIEIGAGTEIPTVRRKSEQCAGLKNAFLVRINPRDYKINSKIGVVLQWVDYIDINKKYYKLMKLLSINMYCND